MSNIIGDLTNVQITEDLKIRANEIFQRLRTGTKRKNNRKRAVFFCVYRAFIELGKVIEPRNVASLIGMDHNEIHKAMSLCSELQTGYSNLIQERSAKDFIGTILENINVKVDNREIENLLDEVFKKDPSLTDDVPQTVAAAAICYFLEINGIKISPVEVASVIKISEMTMKKIKTKIEEAYNLEEEEE